jgi:RNA polymerase sigma factor (sigma-70 family)
MAIGEMSLSLRHLRRLFGEGTVAGLSDAQLLERYASRRDDGAFAALAARHGPMVLAVCRGVLRDQHDAEDAFQATFLVLVRKARSLWVEDSLASWLYRVAYRIAVQANRDADRRLAREMRGIDMRIVESARDEQANELPSVIHEEVNRLPAKYRAPIVLCYLEGLSYEQAAHQLRWPAGTVGGRLARARKLLEARLTRRGLALSSGLLAALTTRSAAAVPTAWINAVVCAATGGVPTRVAAVALSERIIKNMLVTKLKITAVALTAGVATILAANINLAVGRDDDDRNANQSRERLTLATPARNNQPSKPPRATQNPGRTLVFQGNVIDPEGKPRSSAKVYLFGVDLRPGETPPHRATTDADGRFHFTTTEAEFAAAQGTELWTSPMLVVTAQGFGADWVDLKTPPVDRISFQLVRDDVPITGRLLDLEGRPVANAKVRREDVRAEAGGDIDRYLGLVRNDPITASNHNFAKSYPANLPLPGHPREVLTDAQGRFGITGIGRDRIVELSIEGATVQSARITAMTRVSEPISSPRGEFAGRTIHGSKFDYLLPPGRTVTGVVRDKATQKPLAGMTVSGLETTASTTTDAQGRYSLAGFAKGKTYGVSVWATDGSPYFITCVRAPDTAGVAPLVADIECVRGVPFRLRLIDKATGQPVKTAEVNYWPIYPNPHTREVPGADPHNASGPYSSAKQQPDGSFLLGVLPGPGGVLVRTPEGVYRKAAVDPKEFFKNVKHSGGLQGQLIGDRTVLYIASGADGVGGMPQDQFSAIVLTNPADDSGPIETTVVLERDTPREIRVLDPDGAVLAGVRSDGAVATKTPGVLTLSGLNPLRPKRITFYQDEKKLVGFLLARGDEKDAYQVQMQPSAVIVGRLIDAQGKPRPKVKMMTEDWQGHTDDPKYGFLPGMPETSDDGRFRIEGLVPGQSYSAIVVGIELGAEYGAPFRGVILKPGETRNLGDVRSTPAKSMKLE